MGRRKRVLDDGDDSDSSNASEGPDLDDFDNNDPDARAERALFKDPYQRKRPKRNGKEDAIYGVFGDDSEDEGYGRKPAERKKRSDWAKAPAFVSSDKKVDQTMDVDFDVPADEDMEDADSSEESSGGEDDNEVAEQGDDSDASEPSRPASRAPVDEPKEEEAPRFGGIGSFGVADTGDDRPSHAGIGSTKGGIGSSKGGIGSARGGLGVYAAFMSSSSTGSTPSGFGRGGKSSQHKVKDPSPSPEPSTSSSGFPSAFGGRQQNRFIREETPTTKPTQMSADERAHFSKLQGSFGARMLEKMGWQAGTGLGTTGEGIVTPIESKLRPQKMGIAFKGFKEKTEQSKREAKRRGEDVSDDEEDPLTKKMKKKAKEAEKKRSDVWKKPKKVKTKVEHKSYEQILAEAGESVAPAGLGQIIDATGAVPREVSSLAEVSLNTWAPTSDPTKIPEVRHNVRLIADACKSDLDGLAREAKALQERKNFVIQEDARLRKKVEEEAELISRLQQIQLVANEIQAISKELSSLYEVSLGPLSPSINRLVTQFPNEFDNYQLDEIVVASIAPLLRRMVANWNPLEDPSAFLSTFREWRRALKVSTETQPTTQVDIYGARTTISPDEYADKAMTPFESLLWTVWMPRVRSALNNDWSAEDPSPAVKLYESWSSFLPRFIRENVLDQLVLPKVKKAVADWNPKRSTVSLQSIVFPWLPHIGLRLDDVLDDARRKVKSLLKSWIIGEGTPDDLKAWKDVFGKGEWDTLMLKYIVPKLGETLRTEFRIYPPAQKMEPFQVVVAWSDLLRSSIFSQILETEFFPKWLDVLHLWLTQPNVSFEEVAQWYQFWKDAFPESVRNLTNIERGFRYGLQLMNDAITLGPEAPAKLKKPDFRGELAARNAPSRPSSAKDPAAEKRTGRLSARATEITFRAIVEEYAGGHDLLFIPTGRAHEKSRMPLFRVSATADGKHGLLVYVLDDAVWAPQPGGAESDEFKAIGLEDMVSRAKS
ncbi:TFP11-domain-containing protein [Coprinellus micaceus]|uniref:TFP11-domain-containing protein n=1 Tax=Coprinellus micaceus TaxID=71717 RepID=A0A4Y7TRT0_COPMI|nr:TFP11-domain-containing protein [Coprinellus micaceus]